MKRVVAFVPIKLNSQRLPHKNILPLNGHPLCWHIFHTLLKVKLLSGVYVFCSDEEVLQYIPENVIFLKRDSKLDKDEVKGMDIYQEFVKAVDADVYILAHTTSPFTTESSIGNALERVLSQEYDSAFSAQKVQTFMWFRGKPLNYSLSDIPRTQDIEPAYIETSGFFIFQREVLTQLNQRIGAHPYAQEVGNLEAVDIDIEDDYLFALSILGRENEQS